MHQLDMEQAVVEMGAGHLHVIGKAEAPFERAPRHGPKMATVQAKHGD
jgi:hypothetical protein